MYISEHSQLLGERPTDDLHEIAAGETTDTYSDLIAADRVGDDLSRMRAPLDPAAAVAKAAGSATGGKRGNASWSEIGQRQNEYEPFTPENFNNLAPRHVKGLAKAAASYTETGTGNAQRFVARFGHILRHVPDVGWFAWRKGAWRQDDAAAVNLAMQAAWAIGYECEALRDDKAKARRLRHRDWSLGRSGVTEMLALAKPPLNLAADSLDAHPMLLNCANGMVDLSNGDLLPHRPELYASKLSPVAYDKNAPCPAWQKFLEEVFLGDAELIAGVQRLMGYTLTGLVTEQIMVICHGAGSNGKNTLVETMAAVLGDYSQRAGVDTFLETERKSAIPNDIARMRGARYVIASETKKDKALAEATVKQLTGDDRIQARFLHKEFFEYEPNMTIWLITNHKPRITGTDDGIWRRIVLLPFGAKFVDPDATDVDPALPRKDPTLKPRLRAELPGILAWAVRGCLEWQRIGLALPQAVKSEARKYRQNEDTLGAFLAATVERHPGARLPNADLYAAYLLWCSAAGEEPVKGKTFSTLMRERGYEAVKASTMHWLDVTLRDDGDCSRQDSGASNALAQSKVGEIFP